MAHCSICTAPRGTGSTAVVHPELHFVRHRKSGPGTVVFFQCGDCEAELGCLLSREQAAQSDWRVCFDPAALPSLGRTPRLDTTAAAV